MPKIFPKLLVALLLGICLVACQKQHPPISPRFNHVFLSVTNIERSVNFYMKAFDLDQYDEITTLKRTDESGVSNTNEVHIVLLRFKQQNFNLEIGENPNLNVNNTSANYTHLGMDVPNIISASQRLIDAGTTVTRPIALVEANDIKAKTAFFQGPDGETLELMELIEGSF